MVRRSTSLVIEPRGRLFTAADLAALPTHLPSGDVDFELDKGRLILMVPPGNLHGRLQSRLDRALGVQGEDKGHGVVTTETGIVLSRNPDTVKAPDVAFTTAAKLPERESPEGYLETIPDLVVEVRSRNDSSSELAAKVAAYLAAGVRVVWVVEPAAKTVVEHRSGSEPRVYNESDSLTIDDLIPGFKYALKDYFKTRLTP